MSATHPIHVDHPGSFIVEELEERGWSQVDLAYILDMAPAQLNPILTGKTKITPDMANALEAAFDVPAEFFANLQKLYDLQSARKADPGVRTRAGWLATFPVREMIKRGWIEQTEPSLLDLQMMRFFQRNRVEDIPFIGAGTIVAHAAKKQSYDATTPSQYAWLFRTLQIAQRVSCEAYSREKLTASLPRLRAHMQDKDDLIAIPSILAECGVRFVIVECLPEAKIDGVCAWVNDQPVVGISLRHGRMDHLCFVIRHELEHVLQGHGKEEAFTPIDNFDVDAQGSNTSNQDIEEVVANDAAGEYLVPRRLLKSFIARKGQFISERDIILFAARLEINPAIVVGQIQNKTKNYSWLRKYQTSVRDNFLDWPYKDGWGFQFPTEL